jgi:hypothetical protein
MDLSFSQKLIDKSILPCVEVLTVLTLPTDKIPSQGFGDQLMLNGQDLYSQFGLKGHNGIDFATQNGEIIYAPCNLYNCSYIKDEGYGNTLWGYSNEWKSNDEKRTFRLEMCFGHLMEEFQKGKDKFRRFEALALTDNTGKYTTGAHLHWGVRIQEKLGEHWNILDYHNGYDGYFNQFIIIQQMFKLKKEKNKNDIYAIDELKRVKHRICNESTLAEGQRTGLFDQNIETVSTLAVYIDGSEIMLTHMDLNI